MANILYRETMTPEVRTVSAVKASPLTYAEQDSNFKLIDEQLTAIAAGTGLADSGVASAKLANTTVTAGPYGSSTQVASVTFNAKGQATAAASTTIAFPVEAVYTTVYRANADLTTIIPLDDTIPTNTEGTQIATITLTPKSATNKIQISVSGIGTLSAIGNMVYAVFRDSASNALSAGAVYVGSANALTPIVLLDEFIPGVTTPITITLRVGPSAANTMRLNGSTTGRFFGGVSGLSFSLKEIRV